MGYVYATLCVTLTSNCHFERFVGKLPCLIQFAGQQPTPSHYSGQAIIQLFEWRPRSESVARKSERLATTGCLLESNPIGKVDPVGSTGASQETHSICTLWGVKLTLSNIHLLARVLKILSHKSLR
jgi:hypothetical protein